MVMLRDWPPGTIVYTLDRIGEEYREVFYIRDEARPCRYDYDVPVGRFGMAQGRLDAAENGFKFLYARGEPCRDPGEADGRIECYDVKDGGAMWAEQVLGANIYDNTNSSARS